MRLVAASLALAVVASPALAADGAQLFAQCKVCHAAASTPMGPTLKGVAGAKIAGRTDFNYSPALKGKGGTWTDANLNAFLSGPGKFAPGAKMPISVPSAENRAALVAYLKTVK